AVNGLERECDEICASKWIHLKVYPYVSSTWWGEPTWWSMTSSSPGSCASTDCGRSARRSISRCGRSPDGRTRVDSSRSRESAGRAISAACAERGIRRFDRRRHLGVGRLLPGAHDYGRIETGTSDRGPSGRRDH